MEAFSFLGGSAFGGISNYFSQRSANNANVRLWREQAEYNSPKNQMKRLKDAGLNPYLYASGVSGGEMSNAPTINANNGIGDAINQAGQMALNYGSRKMEYDIKKQAEQRMQQQTDFNQEVIRKTTLDADLLNIEKQKRQWELNQLKASYSKINHDIMMDELSHFLNVRKHDLQQAIFDLDKEYKPKYYNLQKDYYDFQKGKGIGDSVNGFANTFFNIMRFMATLGL